MNDVLGLGGTYRDPLWQVGVRLTALETTLLRCAPVRRLAFVSFAGASSLASTQGDSRLEHSLGVFALVAHLAPDDEPARAAALLHDIGHLPLSHTLEGVDGLDHHVLGTARIAALADVLARHGVTADEVTAVLAGTRASVLTPPAGVLKLDHLDGLTRSARAHGRLPVPAPDLLARIRVVDGGVSTDAGTADALTGMIAAEALLHTAPMNVATVAAVRLLVTRWRAHAPAGRPAEWPGWTDDDLWAALLAHPATAASTRELRRDPSAWRVEPAVTAPPPGALTVTVRRPYRDRPLVDGRPDDRTPAAFAGLPELPATFVVVPPPGSDTAGGDAPSVDLMRTQAP